MTIDLGLSGQESDVNRACSAFGLDTVNYRAFPNNGPVTAPESQAVFLEEVLQPVPAPMMAPSEPRPILATPQTVPSAGDPAPQLTPNAGLGYAPTQNQNAASTLPTGFALLQQALPAAFASVTPAPVPAFAMARAPLQPLPSENRAAPPRQVSPAADPESFGVAFGTAYNAAFGTAGRPA